MYEDEDVCTQEIFCCNNLVLQKDAITKSPIYDELLKILLTSLNTLTIRYPGQSDEDTKLMVAKVSSIYYKCYATLFPSIFLYVIFPSD